jgi:hypothetical protein
MRRRSAVLNYVFALLTGGQYGLAWLFLMASDINRQRPDYVPRLRAFAVAFAVLYVVYLALVAYNMFLIGTATAETYQANSARAVPAVLLLAMAIALIAYALFLLIRVGAFVREKGAQAPGNVVLVLLFFLYLISLPLLQSRLNSLHDGHT